ncbi:MAG TPA: site-specific tyrosine recombinase/integron integrase [Patescibacteria group bacterium]|nr:site-specific tyrosine recombinase/integron integrase [Patescibacteria group bacterium]
MEYLEVERGKALNTAKNYDHYLQTFASFAKSHAIESPAKIDEELIKKFRLALNRQNLSKSTQNYYLISLRSFLKYLARKGSKTLSPEKIELIKTPERQITFLEQDELEQILKAPDLKTIQGIRDRAILALFFSTGLRVSELCNLKKVDINLQKSEFSVRGKGGKVRVVFIDENARESLKRYLAGRDDKNEYLFISYGHTNKPLAVSRELLAITPRSVQRMIRKYAKAGGITKHVSPHTMRHSFATDLLIGGADLRSVQEMLGHKSVTTTQIYTHVTNKHLQEVHRAFHGLRQNVSPEAAHPSEKKKPLGGNAQRQNNS